MLRFVFLLQFLVTLTVASYCGQSGIPFSIEILNNGQPFLGCARPTCFGWNAAGKRAADPAMFYKIGQQMDGFLRITDKAGLAAKNASTFQPQFSMCERTYISDRCIGPNQWLGGIAPTPKIDSQEAMKIMCCTYQKLSDSVPKGALKIRPGQSIQGGELRNQVGRQHAFEYVSSIERMFDEHGVVYTVQMRSFNCVPEPNGPAEVDERAEKYLIENINAIDHPTTTPRPPPPSKSQAASSNAKFDERTFELPEDMPSEEPTSTGAPSDSLPPKRLVGGSIPVAQPYEETVIQNTLNNIQRQANEKSFADSDAFRARAHGAPTLTADTPLNQQAAQSSPNANSLPQSHSPQYGQQQAPQYAQMGANPLDPFGLFSGNANNPFGWYVPTSPPTPRSKFLPLEIPTIEDVEKAIPESGRKMISGVVRTLLNYRQ